MSENCGETIVFSCDFGDNPVTFTCNKNKEHAGEHEEKFDAYGKKISVTWTDTQAS